MKNIDLKMIVGGGFNYAFSFTVKERHCIFFLLSPEKLRLFALNAPGLMKFHSRGGCWGMLFICSSS